VEKPPGIGGREQFKYDLRYCNSGMGQICFFDQASTRTRKTQWGKIMLLLGELDSTGASNEEVEQPLFVDKGGLKRHES